MNAASVPTAHTSQLVEHFFRHETGRLHGTLIRLLGVHNMTLAEDVAQEAMLRALRAWSMGGIPENPSAWITRVAMNLARDAFRHHRMSAEKEPAIVTHLEQTRSTPAPVQQGDNEIRDDALRLMFVCCHPSIAPDAQVVLALKVLCGFSTSEIARAFFTSDSAIEKQLTRTKQRIAAANLGFEIPEGEDLAPRLDGVLTALYLLFNEGYKASTGERLLREELCREAIRMTSLLVTIAPAIEFSVKGRFGAARGERRDDGGDPVQSQARADAIGIVAAIEEGRLQHVVGGEAFVEAFKLPAIVRLASRELEGDGAVFIQGGGVDLGA